MSMNKLSFSFVVAAALAAPVAQAAVTQLSSAAQISTSYLNDFESVVSSGPVTFSGGQLYSAAGASSGVTTSGSQGLLSMSFPQDISAQFAGSYNAVGMYFGNDDICCTSGFSAKLEAFSGATSLGSVFVVANMNDYVDQFIGLSSATAFDRVVISYNGAGLYTFVDDFQLGQVAAVPEPETYAMLLAGLGIMGALARRKKQK